MSIADELRKLQELHEQGGLTDEEFATAKAQVLVNQATPDAVLQEHLEEIKEQNDVAALDRAWAAERERYMVTGRYGNRYIPNKASSLMVGFIVAIGGMMWTIMAENMGAPAFFPIFGVLFVLVGLGISIFSYMKADEYGKAYARYQQRRMKLDRRDDS